jgi:simple sugar transport system ATP-binding protein
MLQRIILAREFAEEAPVLVMAEPGGGLDLANRERLVKQLRDYVRPGVPESGGRGILLFSTDVDELLSVADTILVLRDGAFSARISLEALRNASKPDDDTTVRRDIKAQIGRAMVLGTTGAA